jgi:hypothetical protein
LVLSGVLPSRIVTQALAKQSDLRAVDPDPNLIPLALLRRVPEAIAEEMNVLPLSEAGETVVVAVAEQTTRVNRARLETLLGAKIEPQLTCAPTLARARRQAYRRLCVPSALDRGFPRLGETLIDRGVLDKDTLRMALDEQAQTGEMLAELLLRKQLVTAAAIADALPEVLPRFRSLVNDEIDAGAVARLGIGFCSLYHVAPLATRSANDRRTVASAFPLHATVRQTIVQRLEGEFELILAPTMELRVALALASRSSQYVGLEGAKLAAISALLGDNVDLDEVIRGARESGLSPIDWLRQKRGIDALTAARIRAHALGIPTAEQARSPIEGVVPPQLASAHDIDVCEAEEGAFVMASSRPTPWLAREVAKLLPHARIAWRVAIS